MAKSQKGEERENGRKIDEIILFLEKCGIIRVERKYCREEITMNTETYILTKLAIYQRRMNY